METPFRLGSGRALPRELAHEFGRGLGHDLGSVRVHTDGQAQSAAAALNSRAFTWGRNVVFGAGEWQPETHEGRRVLAHELVHSVQQGGNPHRVQRLLKIDKAASDDPATAVSMMTPLVNGLCPDFDIASGGEISAKDKTDCAGGRFTKVSTGTQPIGCCCLCTLVRAPDKWTVIVTNTNAPTTDPGGRIVRMTQVGVAGAPTFRHWSSGAGGATERQVDLPPVEAFGHELCGHAALMQIKAHPPSLTTTPDRAFSDVHDPTVKVQNALASEMALPGPRRGLAGGGTHRGESIRVLTVGPFPTNDASVASVATSLASAVAFLNSNSRLQADVVGFRDGAELPIISLLRSVAVFTHLVTSLSPLTTSIQMTPSGGPTTIDRLQGLIDGGTGSAIVEVLAVARPAGLRSPPPPAPPATPVHVDPEFPAVVAALKAGGTGVNACHKLLTDTAWP